MSHGSAGSSVKLESCPVGKPLPENMKWDYDTETKKMVHRSSGNCLDADKLAANNFIKVQTCADKDTQKWDLEFLL